MGKYLLRRVLLLVPTLAAIAIISFIIIQLPPGDYLTYYISELETRGTVLDESNIESLRQRYGLGDSMPVQFGKWIWGVVQGDFGMSFQRNRPVSELIGERITLTVVISVCTLLFTWAVAMPIGVYSATHQYSVGDYMFTFFGFLGRGIPDFMLALILMWVSLSTFKISVGGLFSYEFQEASWSLAKVWDLLKHLWVPVVVLGTGGTAGLVRVMRANLLDELHKQYVITARAKGVGERTLLFKYPVRIAMNPFISTLGWYLPSLISGVTIVSVVLSLPTAGPLLLFSLTSQDMYLAGTFVLLLSTLTVIGTFVSDIMLALLDPRIRFGARG